MISTRVNGEGYVPTPADIWDFLQGFKAATEAGFGRIQLELSELRSSFESRFERIEARLDSMESWNVDRRLDDHEQRILRLEQRFAPS